MRALLLVDIQNDFLPGGALSVREGEQIIPVINELVKKDFDLIIASKDWHPKDHLSFAKSHRKQPGEVMDLFGLQQTLWPVHCVQGTRGAEFAPGWDTTRVKKIFFKGTDKQIDSYSAFFDNAHRKATGLGEYLKEKRVQELYIAGLATDYCVRSSVIDAIQLGFHVYVIEDACKAINLTGKEERLAFEEMIAAGAKIISSKSII